ncbi:MAG: 30S ribosomal protein S6 [Microgenomates group bacterium GW2011_GWA2_44_7]|nr:MAG: 30S ribosomal protein S6 [Microgenomates group bacterium GW2011_GWA2_44_7]KKT77307.1 MAG: 30S ribosomal protein S6 [Microgenomates group bacterium GW2011_GWB1_44_8]
MVERVDMHGQSQGSSQRYYRSRFRKFGVYSCAQFRYTWQEMSTYELTVITKPDEKTSASVVSKVKGWIEAAKGKIEKTDNWGVKTLTYQIKKLSEGSYTLLTFTCDPANVKSIENRLKLETEIIRYLLVLG